MPKYNYSAENILHVYKQTKKEINRVFDIVRIKPKYAHGNFYFQTDEIFTDAGDKETQYNNVGYGGVYFLGNINGKVPTNGLYYKSMDIKKQIESFIISISLIQDEKTNAVQYIQEQHGQPTPQHCILWQLS